MTKQRLQESLRSFIGNCIDPEKDEELKGTKEEVEGKVQKILKLLRSEDEKDLEEPVTDLIEDFFKQYQSLSARYELLTGQLREKVNGKQETRGSSSTSDSDTDDSPRENDLKYRTLAKEFNEATEVIKQELETAKSEVSELRVKLAAASGENEAMKSENQNKLTKIEVAESVINDLNAEVEMWKAENSKLLAVNAELNLKVETTLGRLEEGNTALEELKTIISRMNDEKEDLLLQLEVAKGESTSFRVELRPKDKEKIQDLEAESTQLREKLDEKEKEYLAHMEMHEAYLSDAIDRARGLGLELDSLQAQRIGSNKQKKNELSAISENFKDKDISQIEGLTAHISKMQLEIESLQVQKREMKELVLRNRNEASACIKDLTEQLIEKQLELETTLNSKIELQVNQLNNLQKKFESREAEASDQITSLNNQVTDLQRKLDSLSSQKSESDFLLEKKSLELSEYLVQMEKLKDEIATRSADGKRIVEDIEDLRLQVSNFTTQLEYVHAQNKELDDQILNKDNEINLLRKLKEAMQNKILEQKNVVLEKSDELLALQKKLDDAEKESSTIIIGLTNQVDTLHQQVQELSKEETEMKSTMKNMEQLEQKMRQLQMVLEEKNGKVEEFERTMKEKDSRFLDLSEEKREVIRQLCVWIEYQQTRYDDLREIISKMAGTSR